ncbi:MAG: FYDLN acid domain-containing protein [Alphaproteobacteria bacterium]
MAPVISLDENATNKFGFRRICHDCNTHYYDKGRWPVGCPECGAIYHVNALLKSGGSTSPRANLATKRAPAPAQKKNVNDKAPAASKK